MITAAIMILAFWIVLETELPFYIIWLAIFVAIALILVVS